MTDNDNAHHFESPVDAAIYYSQMGFAVLPLHYIEDGKCSCGNKSCKSPGKHPMTTNGLKDATKDSKKVASWWHDSPSANIGIRTGKISGIFVLDLDIKEDKNGVDSLSKLGKKYNNSDKFPDTLRQKTGSGGYHLIYKYPYNKNISNLSTGLVLEGVEYPGIDIRGENGYIVASPSNHKSGGSYKLYDADIADCPTWLLKVLTNRNKDKTSTRLGTSPLTEQEIEAIGEQLKSHWGVDSPESATDHRSLAKNIAALLRMKGIDRDSAVDFIVKFNHDNPCADGRTHPSSDLKHIVKDYYDREYPISTDFDQELKQYLFNTISPRRPGMTCYTFTNEDICFDGVRQEFISVSEYFDDHGNEHEKVQRIHYVPISLNGVAADINYTDADDRYKLDVDYKGKRMVVDIDTLITFISTKTSTSSADRGKISEFLHKYQRDHIPVANLYYPEPIWLDDNGNICVEWITDDFQLDEWPDIDVGKVLHTLNEIHNMTTHPDSFVRTMAWSLFAPMSYMSRSRGWPVPFKALSGRTEGAKTSMALLFLSTGYAQERSSVLLGENQIETKFTEMMQLSLNIMPKVFDDVSVRFLSKRESFFKNIYLGTIAGTRGRSNQTLRQYLNKSNFILTINEDLNLSLAQRNRYDTEYYTEEHEKRQDVSKYERLRSELPDGFLLAIFREIFRGENLDDIMSEMHRPMKTRSEWNDRITSYCLSKINQLCKSYGVPQFYADDKPSDDDADHFSMFCEYMMDQWDRLNKLGAEKKTSYPRLGLAELDVDEIEKGSYIIWFTSSGFTKAMMDMRLDYRMVKDFFNEYRHSDYIEIMYQGKRSSHRFSDSTPVKGYAISYHPSRKRYNDKLDPM